MCRACCGVCCECGVLCALCVLCGVTYYVMLCVACGVWFSEFMWYMALCYVGWCGVLRWRCGGVVMLCACCACCVRAVCVLCVCCVHCMRRDLWCGV